MRASKFSMPLSCSVALSAFSDENAMARPLVMSRPLPSIDRALDVARLRAVEADDDGRRFWKFVFAVVDRNRGGALDVHLITLRSFPRKQESSSFFFLGPGSPLSRGRAASSFSCRSLEGLHTHLIEDIADRHKSATHMIGIEPPDAADAE